VADSFTKEATWPRTNCPFHRSRSPAWRPHYTLPAADSRDRLACTQLPAATLRFNLVFGGQLLSAQHPAKASKLENPPRSLTPQRKANPRPICGWTSRQVCLSSSSVPRLVSQGFGWRSLRTRGFAQLVAVTVSSLCVTLILRHDLVPAAASCFSLDSLLTQHENTAPAFCSLRGSSFSAALSRESCPTPTYLLAHIAFLQRVKGIDFHPTEPWILSTCGDIHSSLGMSF